MKKRLTKTERFPTKTDIKGIERWLKKEADNQFMGCPFSRSLRSRIPWPHWKCIIAFPYLEEKIKKHFRKKGWSKDCPCDNYSLKYIKMVARCMILTPNGKDL